MQRLHAENLYQIGRFLEVVQRVRASESTQQVMAQYSEFFDGRINLAQTFEDMGMRVSLSQWTEAIREVAKSSSADLPRVTQVLKSLQSCIRHELKMMVCLQVLPDKVFFYESEHLFGPETSAKWPSLVEDISEAGKCIALGRFTASVFHLMRVMEIGVQEFGKKLSVSLFTDKPWGMILNEAKAPIDAMEKGDPQKILFNEAWAHLDSVRLAWRNEVMHPKQTYTEEEAMEIFGHVRTYMRHLVSIL